MSYNEWYRLQEKYKDYKRKNTLKGWIKHLYLVFLSFIVKKPK